MFLLRPKISTILVVVITCSEALVSSSPVSGLPNSRKVEVSYWVDAAQEVIQNSLNLDLNRNTAKNIIFFLGDGMGISTVTASRIFKGQLEKHNGEETLLEFEKFPYITQIKTYNVDRQVPDSAGTATAFLCGVKGNYETVGLDSSASHNDCNSTLGAEVTSILSWAQDAGKETGFITTARVTHATPAGLFAHSANRYWETEVPSNASQCKDIARQLIEDLPGKLIKVIFGGGRGYFTPNNESDPLTRKNGLRKDKRNLIEDWKAHKIYCGFNHAYVIDRNELENWDATTSEYILGLFDFNHMSYDSDRSPDQPSLKEMTKKAITRLQRSENGYFLFVEGGRIDHAHHAGLVRHSLEDTVAFDEAVKTAVEMTDELDTLIVVTADHSHVLTINGYPKRGNPILGFAGTSDVDGMLYTTLMYTNGPGMPEGLTGRANLSNVDTGAKNFTPQVAVPLTEETHGGEDVILYARGPMAHLFHGVQEQSYIPHALAYAACMGINVQHCNAQRRSVATQTPLILAKQASSQIALSNGLLLLVLLILIVAL